MNAEQFRDKAVALLQDAEFSVTVKTIGPFLSIVWWEITAQRAARDGFAAETKVGVLDNQFLIRRYRTPLDFVAEMLRS